MSTPSVSNRYRNQEGKAYFAYQNQGSLQRGRINARKFAAYIKPTDRILDFGCGGGSFLLSIDCAYKVGVEINETARDEASKQGLKVYEHVNDVEIGSVNLIISNHALEHVLNPYETLKTLYQILEPAGQIVLALPIDDWKTQTKPDMADINHHLYTWTPLLIGNLLHEAGYINIDAHILAHAWPPKNWQKLDAILPNWAFDLICRFVAWRDNRRQVIATANKPSQ